MSEFEVPNVFPESWQEATDKSKPPADELTLEQVKNLTALVHEVRVAASTLPEAERRAIVESRNSIAASRFSAMYLSGRREKT